MKTSFAEFTDSEKDKFNRRIGKYKIDPQSVPKRWVTDKPTTVSGHPELWTNKPARVYEAANVKELKELGGIPDSNYTSGQYSDAFVKYPPPVTADMAGLLKKHGKDKCALEASLSLDFQDDVRKALRAFIQGNSQRVADYTPFIDMLHFPMQVTVAAAEDIVITKGNPLVIDNPGQVTHLVFGTMTIEPGGFVELVTEARIDTNVLIRK